jgi:hypothetical protein
LARNDGAKTARSVPDIHQPAGLMKRIGGWAFRGLLNLPVMWETDTAQLLARSNLC